MYLHDQSGPPLDDSTLMMRDALIIKQRLGYFDEKNPEELTIELDVTFLGTEHSGFIVLGNSTTVVSIIKALNDVTGANDWDNLRGTVFKAIYGPPFDVKGQIIGIASHDGAKIYFNDPPFTYIEEDGAKYRFLDADSSTSYEDIKAMLYPGELLYRRMNGNKPVLRLIADRNDFLTAQTRRYGTHQWAFELVAGLPRYATAAN